MLSINGDFKGNMLPHRYLNIPLGRATVISYDETSPKQSPIPADCFYTRREYNPSHGFVTVCTTLVVSIFIPLNVSRSPLLKKASRACVGGPTIPMNRIPCISALASGVNDGFTRAACKKTDIFRTSRLTNATKSPWISPGRELGGSLQTFCAWPARQS
jgi:hypothetical protein